MINQEILHIARDPAESGVGVDRIAGQFRAGRNVDDLLALLDSADWELASLGAWILSDLPLDLYNFDRFISRLRKLVAHDEAAVRFHAFDALLPALNWQDSAAHTLLGRLRRDPNEGVRRSAEDALSVCLRQSRSCWSK